MRGMTDTTLAAAPRAAKKLSTATHHGITVEDHYAWLRDPGYPNVTDKAVLAHLAAENAWFEARMAPHQATIEALFKEMRGRIKEADKSVPQKDGDWLYWIEFEEGAEYKKWWRRPLGAKDDGSADELLLDEPALAEGKEYFRLGAISVSRNGRLLAYSIDDNGSERFSVRIKDLATGEHLPDEIPGTLSALIWVAGDTGLVYSLANEQWRTDNARLHWLGKPLEEDVELYHEDDEGFRVSVSLSANEEWLIVGTGVIGPERSSALVLTSAGKSSGLDRFVSSTGFCPSISSRIPAPSSTASVRSTPGKAENGPSVSTRAIDTRHSNVSSPEPSG